MTQDAYAWSVLQIAELVCESEERLRGALQHLDVNARAAMPEDCTWLLGSSDTDALRILLGEHAEIAERLRMLVEQLPEHGVAATYDDVSEAAAASLADGILDPASALMTAGALNVATGWTALAEALLSTDVRSGWADLRAVELLGAFRRVDPRLVDCVLNDVGVDPEACWAHLTADATHRLAGSLPTYATQL